jgi:tetratricopeptide (TPR) repeat protein
MQKRINKLILALCTVLWLATPGGSSAVSDEANRHFIRGMAAVEIAKTAEDYDLAIDEFKQARSLAPDWPDVYYNLGLIQEKAGKYMDAASSLRKYLQLTPDSPNAAEIKALIYKAELKAEQVITDEDILNIFVSLTDKSHWQIKGITNANLFSENKWIKSIKRDGQEMLQITWPCGNCPSGVMSQSHRISGRKLEFGTFYNLCNESVQKDNCPEGRRYWLEVVSRNKVTMRMRYWYPEIMGGGTKDASFEFVHR